MESQKLDRWSARLSTVGIAILLLVFAELLGFLLVRSTIFLISVECLLFVALAAHLRMQFLAFAGNLRKRYFLYVIPVAARVVLLLLTTFVVPFGIVLAIGVFVVAEALLLTGLITMGSELQKDASAS